jgi:hypothetical protein
MVCVITDHMIDDFGIANARRLLNRNSFDRWIRDRIHDPLLIGDGAPFAGIRTAFGGQIRILVRPLT